MVRHTMRVGALAILVCTAGCQTASAPAPAQSAEETGGRAVKSRDGSFSGKVYGVPVPDSALSLVQVGMRAEEVQQIMGGSPDDIRSYPTGKTHIPFYFGSDGARLEWIYKGRGSVAFAAGRGRTDVVVVIVHDPRM